MLVIVDVCYSWQLMVFNRCEKEEDWERKGNRQGYTEDSEVREKKRLQ